MKSAPHGNIAIGYALAQGTTTKYRVALSEKAFKPRRLWSKHWNLESRQIARCRGKEPIGQLNGADYFRDANKCSGTYIPVVN
jgi:hypothetical protein